MSGTIVRLNEQLESVQELSFSVSDLIPHISIDSAPIVGLSLSNPVDFALNYVRTLHEGKVPLILNPNVPVEELKKMAQSLGASSLITNETDARFEQPASGLGSGKHILCSSGTTSLTPTSKTFVFNVATSLLNGQAHLESIGRGQSGAKFLLPMPITHSFGLVAGLLSTIQNSNTLYTLPDSVPALGLLKAVEQYEIDHLYLTPSLVRMMIKALKRKKETVKGPKSISIGSAILYGHELVELMSFLPETQFYFTYGLTEMGPRTSTLNCGTKDVPHACLQHSPERPVAIGLPLPEVEAKIEAEQLWLKSPYQALNLKLDTDGFHNSSDQAEVVEGAGFRIHGRADFTIIKSGMNIYPSEIEGKLMDLPFLIACCIISQKSDVYGQVPVLVGQILATEDAEKRKTEIYEHLGRFLPVSHLPSAIILRTEPLPRTPVGKIKVMALIKEYETAR